MSNNLSFENFGQFDIEEMDTMGNVNSINRDSDIEESAWLDAVNKNTKEAYLQYIKSYPRGKCVEDARNMIANLGTNLSTPINEKTASISLESKQRQKESTKEKKGDLGQEYLNENYDFNTFLSEFNNQLDNTAKVKFLHDSINKGKIDVAKILYYIKHDNNLFEADDVVCMIEDAKLFKYNDLQKCTGIDDKFIRALAQKLPSASLGIEQQDINISRNSTEIFFWGIPATGKTCALGAILSVIKNGKVVKAFIPQACQGRVYLEELSDRFDINGKVTILPKSTSGTYEMAFDIIDKKNNLHKITLIDFAGEILRMNTDKLRNRKLSSEQEEKDFSTMLSLLEGVDKNGKDLGVRKENRKMHFIVVEYGSADKIYKGIKQRDYLDDALTLIESTGILRTNTDAICLIVTKADKMDKESYKDVKDFMEKVYPTFLGRLEYICEQNRIRNGFIILPFSLGSVCFKKYCKLDTEYAKDIARIIVEETHSEPQGFWRHFKK